MSSGREGGGNKPAKVFRNIVNELWTRDDKWREVLREKGRMPVAEEVQIASTQTDEVPDLTGAGLRDALYILENLGYQCEYSGVGHVVKQVINGNTIKLTLE
jgi:hypothetical protein